MSDPPAMFRCYGLSVASTLPLSELERHPDEHAAPDVTIRESAVGPRDPAAVLAVDGLWTTGASTWLEVSGVARFLITDGRDITFEREPGVVDGDVKLFLLGTALGAALWQRGHLVLHGNAFRVGASAAIVVGHSGAGKSTIAGELAGRGYDVLSDDVVPVDGAGMALPGYPRIKLWDHALGVLGLSAEGYERITAAHDKFNVPISRGELGPLAADFIYVLESHDVPSLELVEVAGVERFDVLRTHTYRRELAADRGAAMRHLDRCAALAARARIVRVRRPAATMTPAASVDAIIADVHAHAGDVPGVPAAGR